LPRNDVSSVLLFESSGMVLRATRLADSAGFQVKTIPTPKRFSSDCGVSLQVRTGDVDAVLKLLAANHVREIGVHVLTG